MKVYFLHVLLVFSNWIHNRTTLIASSNVSVQSETVTIITDHYDRKSWFFANHLVLQTIKNSLQHFKKQLLFLVDMKFFFKEKIVDVFQSGLCLNNFTTWCFSFMTLTQKYVLWRCVTCSFLPYANLLDLIALTTIELTFKFYITLFEWYCFPTLVVCIWSNCRHQFELWKGLLE